MRERENVSKISKIYLYRNRIVVGNFSVDLIILYIQFKFICFLILNLDLLKIKLKRENSKFSFGGIFFKHLSKTNLKINKIS